VFQLILAESFSKVVLDVHKNLPSTTPIEVELKLSTDYLEIRILEQGKPFYFLAYLMAGIPYAYENNYCGFGDTPIIQNLIDELYYITLPEKGNCLIMRKRLDLLQ
jgi:serine/threonine-protein kinase RsbW